MLLRDKFLITGSIVGGISLLFGVGGQVAFIGPMIKPYMSGFMPVIAVIVFMLPWLIVHTITFTKEYFLPPRQIRRCLLFALCWFASVTVGAEVLYHLGYMPSDSPRGAVTACRVFMHVGWLSLLKIIPIYQDMLRYESKRDA